MALPLVVVIGGTGFVGRHVVTRLVDAGYRVSVPTRRRGNARELFLLPTVDVVEADVRDATALASLARGATAMVNLAGILNESRRETFAEVHLGITERAIAACKSAGVRRLLHMSALNADPAGPSRYLATKGQAEAAVTRAGLASTIFRPSVIFGREDAFLNRFARMLRFAPIFPLPCPDAKFQPVYVGDVAHCFVRALSADGTIGGRYPLCGPNIYTLRELIRYVGAISGNVRPILTLGPALSRLQAIVLEHLPGKPMSRDNLLSMQRENVCGCDFPAVFGIVPAALEALVPAYLAPEAAHSPFDQYRAHGGR